MRGKKEKLKSWSKKNPWKFDLHEKLSQNSSLLYSLVSECFSLWSVSAVFGRFTWADFPALDLKLFFFLFSRHTGCFKAINRSAFLLLNDWAAFSPRNTNLRHPVRVSLGRPLQKQFFERRIFFLGMDSISLWGKWEYPSENLEYRVENPSN